MPEPIAIFGATDASYALVKEIYGYIESWVKAGTRAEEIQMWFGWTKQQLKFFA